MPAPHLLVADLTWVDRRFQRGLAVEVDAAGRIGAVTPEAEAAPELPRERLRGRALLPGLVSAHSHAFQRGLRGRGETFASTTGSFWTWRAAMYDLVASLDGDAVERLSLAAFREMRRAGITCVGEFHYLHHGPQRLDWALDERILAAAHAAGIRIVLLETFYRTGAIGEPLEGAQRRFDSLGPDAFWNQMDHLDHRLQDSTQSLGVAVHSIRAASLEDLAAITREARRRGLPVHLHVEEQRREIDEASAVYGRPPMEVILDTVGQSAGLTAVHCTHTRPRDLARFLEGGGMVCVCPLTEANLGDGLPEIPATRADHGQLCLGSDSNTRISLLEEMRWLEYGQRLRRESRGVLRDERGKPATVLLEAATVGGARSLGIAAGVIARGQWADFVAIDLEAPALAGTDAETFAAALVFGAPDEVVVGTAVGGVWSDARSR